MKRAKNLCACAIDRTRLMEQLGLRGDPLLLSATSCLYPLPCTCPCPRPCHITPQQVSASSFGQLSLQVFARCGLRIFFQIKLESLNLCLACFTFLYPILACLNLFNLLRRRRLRRRRRPLKASATHNNFSHSVGGNQRSPLNRLPGWEQEQQEQPEEERQLATDLHTRKAHLSKTPNELAKMRCPALSCSGSGSGSGWGCTHE